MECPKGQRGRGMGERKGTPLVMKTGSGLLHCSLTQPNHLESRLILEFLIVLKECLFTIELFCNRPVCDS